MVATDVGGETAVVRTVAFKEKETSLKTKLGFLVSGGGWPRLRRVAGGWGFLVATPKPCNQWWRINREGDQFMPSRHLSGVALTGTEFPITPITLERKPHFHQFGGKQDYNHHPCTLSQKIYHPSGDKRDEPPSLPESRKLNIKIVSSTSLYSSISKRIHFIDSKKDYSL
ncbi:hypothetical protein PIB30_092534 [Stylosanthes scabra]|uniref:Uncharacterized protein n=1 Tax=Stylosanthes scabra TaxID=79078 RepID=A0ABU6QVZ6_9FABA|nr:hypothetical protein [Stylosanthes scabra]